MGLLAEGYPEVIQNPVLEYESPKTTMYFVSSLVLAAIEKERFHAAARARAREKEIMPVYKVE